MKPILAATWWFAPAALPFGGKVLDEGGSALDAVLATVTHVENDPSVDSVGFGGLPNVEGEVETDSAIMRGDSLHIGAVMGLKGFKNPILVAADLANEHYNNVLCGEGAARYADKMGHTHAVMITDEIRRRWEEKVAEGQNKPSGHDTVGCLGLDAQGHIVVGVSTSGLFMKRPGRVGDSPISGSGFYADDQIGAAVATGVGEDIMKGCLSFAIVQAIASGMTPQEATDKIAEDFITRIDKTGDELGHFAVLAIDKEGRVGAACMSDVFTYSYWQDGELHTVKPVTKRAYQHT